LNITVLIKSKIPSELNGSHSTIPWKMPKTICSKKDTIEKFRNVG